MTRKSARWAGMLLAAAGLAGCHNGENPFGLRGRSRVPYIVERPAFADATNTNKLNVSGYAGFNYGPAPIVAPIDRPAR